MQQEEPKNLPVKKPHTLLWLILGGVLFVAIGYCIFSYYHPESSYSINKIFKKVEEKTNIRYGFVKPTLKNARIAIFFQDNVDITEGKEILKRYADANPRMTYDVFQDRHCDFNVKPNSADIQYDIMAIKNIVVFGDDGSFAESRDMDGNIIMTGTISGTLCADIKKQIEAEGYTVTRIMQIPAYATVMTETNKKEALLATLQKDTANFQKVEFGYPE